MVGRSHEEQKRKGLSAGFDSQRYQLLSSNELVCPAYQEENGAVAPALIQRVFVLLLRREPADRTVANQPRSEHDRSQEPTAIS
jgi:hypothetical protein